MSSRWVSLLELLVVLSFVLGWGVLELVALGLDWRRAEERAKQAAASAASGTAADIAPRDGGSDRDPGSRAPS
jgi:hypothetical protein